MNDISVKFNKLNSEDRDAISCLMDSLICCDPIESKTVSISYNGPSIVGVTIVKSPLGVKSFDGIIKPNVSKINTPAELYAAYPDIVRYVNDIKGLMRIKLCTFVETTEMMQFDSLDELVTEVKSLMSEVPEMRKMLAESDNECEQVQSIQSVLNDALKD